MRIDYCPHCNKAGLKYERFQQLCWQPEHRTKEQIDEYELNHSQGKKWCSRCKMWVKPVSKEWRR
jgi:hypothetical protein